MPEIRAPIVGMKHHDGAFAKLNAMEIGAAIELQREPGNPYDAQAIRCYADGVMVGYIPKTHNGEIARTMDRGLYEVRARYVVRGYDREPPRIIVSWE